MGFEYNHDASKEDPATLEKKLHTKADGTEQVFFPIKFNVVKPTDTTTGQLRDQTGDAARNMRYAHSLKLPVLKQSPRPRMGKAVIVGGAPSIKNHLDAIRKLSEDPDNAIFALNWTHTWLIDRGIIPYGTVFFEIDAEPDSVLQRIHKDVTYYICSHCDAKTFDALEGYKRILWHSIPNSDGERVVFDEIFKEDVMVGGGINSFTRTVSVALLLGFRNIELFGCDGSFPADSPSTHVEGYETVNNVKTDSLEVLAEVGDTGERKLFKTVGYLALQTEEFKEYCRINHQMYACRVHGDGLLNFIHTHQWPDQYEKLP